MGFWHKKTAKIACFMTRSVKMAEKFVRDDPESWVLLGMFFISRSFVIIFDVNIEDFLHSL